MPRHEELYQMTQVYQQRRKELVKYYKVGLVPVAAGAAAAPQGARQILQDVAEIRITFQMQSS